MILNCGNTHTERYTERETHVRQGDRQALTVKVVIDAWGK